MMSTRFPRRPHLTAVLLFTVVASLPGCVIHATAAPEESAVATAPPPTGTQEEAARLERERAERERAERERAERERLAKERAEQERVERERIRTERLERERLERERVRAERLERQRIERERAEKERAERERVEKERAERARVEKERVEKERVDRERGEKERADREPIEVEPVATDPHAAEDDDGADHQGPRKLEGVPPGHFPTKADECRLWLVDTPPGRQPKAEACSRFVKVVIPEGAFILHAGRAWDSGYDWAARAEIEPESVPEVILRILRTRLVEAGS
jgi:hypothetical protein